jgi:hypothetical protein
MEFTMEVLQVLIPYIIGVLNGAIVMYVQGLNNESKH